MPSNQELSNQLFRAALIYPFVIVVLCIFSSSLCEKFLDALPNDENSRSEETGDGGSEPESEPVLVTIQDSQGADHALTPSTTKRSEIGTRQNASAEGILQGKGDKKDVPKCPPALIAGLIFQSLQLYYFYQISNITTGTIHATNDISIKVTCGIGFCLATFVILITSGQLSSVYASARAGRRAKYETWTGEWYDMFIIFSLIVVVYSWGRFAWA